MHYKKRKLHKLHSIPIGLCNKVDHNRLYLVSYSIPLSCMVVLLLTGIFAINPSLALRTSAVTIQDEWVVKDSDLGNDAANAKSVSLTDTENLLRASADSYAPSLSLTVDNTEQVVNAVQGGKTVYGVYGVTLVGNNVLNYTLSMKANSSNLTMPTGASGSTSTVSGADGKSGSSMVANTWGYNFADASVSEANYNNLSYTTLPTTDNRLAGGDAADSNTVNLSKKLIFAAKFAETAAPGRYSASITLSAAATPAIIGQVWSNGVDSEVKTMQDFNSTIRSKFCGKDSNTLIPVGTTLVLKDDRSGYDSGIMEGSNGHNHSLNEYVIVKLKNSANDDTSCWMQENLRLKLSADGLDASESDLTSNWDSSSSIKPLATLSSGWINNGSKSPVSAYYNNPTNGAYYSWAAAIAGTYPADLNTPASGSVCPKNWKLPGRSEQTNLLNGLNRDIVLVAPYKYLYSGVAGSSGASGVGQHAGYWTNASYPYYDYAYSFYFDTDRFFSPASINQAGSGTKTSGYSVRCLAAS